VRRFATESTSSSHREDKQMTATVLYRGAFIRPFRLLIRLKLAQVSPPASPALLRWYSARLCLLEPDHHLQLGAAAALAVPLTSSFTGSTLPPYALALSGSTGHGVV